MSTRAVVGAKGARRWAGGHPWIFRSDVRDRPDTGAGVVPVHDTRGAFLGHALWSPASEISLRLLDTNPDATIDDAWWHARIAQSHAARAGLRDDVNACRLVHGEGDGLPSLVVDQYDRWLVVQFLSAGLETFREPIVRALLEVAGPEAILARNDAAVRTREGLPRVIEAIHGIVPRTVEVREHAVRYLAAPHDGQKTGAFLDQRENRLLAGRVARGRALDCFAYHGSFALHLARGATHVRAVDASAEALARGRENAALNGCANIDWVEADVFDLLRAELRGGARYDTIVLDPPAFAKNRASLHGALRGYHDINVHALRLLAPGGALFTASCSYHVTKPLFLEMLQGAAADAHRRVTLLALTGQPGDHPEILTIPETGYLKGALLRAD
ncbi:MAG TPA: class I SAM-dependent rRNA methyltransferase [Gemmatimonadaceae bacterium]|nr:class I SAM-dependent rRNA methyltransferase [Gemmatimonadaceae bacterium]